MPSTGWYYRLSSFFKETFGEKVYKIPLDAGFSCPNRDGTISTGGCIFCYNPSFSPAALDSEKKGRTLSVTEQIRSFQLRAEKKAEKSEAWPKAHETETESFQPRRKYSLFPGLQQHLCTPTAPAKTLRRGAECPGIVGLSIATRPDCLGPGVLELLQSYAQKYHIWLELGLQSPVNTRCG